MTERPTSTLYILSDVDPKKGKSCVITSFSRELATIDRQLVSHENLTQFVAGRLRRKQKIQTWLVFYPSFHTGQLFEKSGVDPLKRGMINLQLLYRLVDPQETSYSYFEVRKRFQNEGKPLEIAVLSHIIRLIQSSPPLANWIDFLSSLTLLPPYLQFLVELTGFSETTIETKAADTSLHSPLPVQPSIQLDKLESFFDRPFWTPVFPAYQPRQQQIRFAKAIYDSIQRRDPLIIETGTGTGKTLGYLIPILFLLAQKPDLRFIISTSMKNLQNQIVDKEISRLQQVFPQLLQQVTITTLKGRGNYLCRTSVKQDFEKLRWKTGQTLSETEIAVSYLNFLLELSDQMDMEGLADQLSDGLPALFETIESYRSDIACTPGHCNAYGRCNYDELIKSARLSNIVVVNHAKLLNLPEDFLVGVEAVIVDECDGLLDYIRSNYSVELHHGFINRLNKWMDAFERKVHLSGSGSAMDLLFEIRSHQEQLSRYGAALHQQISRLQQKTSLISPESDVDVMDPLFSIAEALNGIKELVDMISEESTIRSPVLGFYLGFYSEQATRLISNENDGDYAWFTSYDAKGWTVGKRLVEVRDRFLEAHMEKAENWIFTSATIQINQSFDSFIQALALESIEPSTLAIQSPFFYREQGQLLIPGWIPKTSYDQSGADRQWIEAIAQTCAYLCLAGNGRALILCTSFDQMTYIQQRLTTLLSPFSIPVIGQKGASIDEIDLFQHEERSVLVGVDRFWTGVDFVGPTLSLLIMVKLPFPHIHQPEWMYRREHDQDNYWTKYNEESALRFRQGVGRLIRSMDDCGSVVLMDKRVLNGSYRSFLLNLPPELPVELVETPEQLLSRHLKITGLEAEYLDRKSEIRQTLDEITQRLNYKG